ncbi:MAG: VOC family protein [Clostridiales bacterium]|jgi:catechol 2,3-dioxygenase-like lactoylglutathione lyase family enzyme|nr:VOC family protein [Clostridiales bacterium]
MITGIAHGAVTVKNMEESLRFYTEGLGFTKVFEINNPKDGAPWIVYLNVCKGQFIELFYDGVVENPWKPELIGFNHFCFEVDDIFASCEKLKAAGYTLDIEPNQGCDYNMQAWVTDPNGIRVELMQIDPRSPHAKYM